MFSRSQDGTQNAFGIGIMLISGRSLTDGAATFIAPHFCVMALGTLDAPSGPAASALISWETGVLLGHAVLTSW